MSRTSDSALPFPVARVAAVALVSVATGLASGAVLGAIGRFIYIPLVSPALAAAAAGAGSMIALGLLRTPGVTVARAIGSLTGTACIVGLLLVTLSLARADLIATLTAKGGSSADALQDAVEKALGERGGGGVIGPLTLRVHSGVTVAGETKVELGSIGNAVLLGLEWALAIAIASVFTLKQGRKPFSRRKQAWLRRRVVGRAAEGVAASIISDLEKQQFHRVGRRLDSASGGVVLVAWTDADWSPGAAAAPSPGAGEPVELEVVTEPSGGRPLVVHRCRVDDAALTAICESVAVRREGSV